MDVAKTGHILRMIISNINNVISEKVEPYGIKGGQFEYFLFIYQNEGINQSQLAKIKNVGKASVTKAVKILEENDFIYREVDEKDKRNYKLYPSQKGKKYVDSMLEQRTAMEEIIFESFSEKEKETLVSLLSRMLKNTEKLS
jgi:DNA-binding MarR family transcriptional regulator